MAPTIFAFSGKCRTRKRMGTSGVFRKYHSTLAAESAVPTTVASALPWTPQPKPDTNSALNAVQPTAPITMVHSARFGAPVVRMKLLRPAPTSWNTLPTQRI